MILSYDANLGRMEFSEGTGCQLMFTSNPFAELSAFIPPTVKRVAEANGTRSNLPAPADAPKIYGSVLRQPRHY